MDNDNKQRAILKERAQRLALPQKSSDQAKNTVEMLQFSLARGIYAIESEFVREVSRLKSLTPLPTTPDHILGLINIRRKITPVIDLQILFGLPKQEANIGKKVILLKNGEVEFGILADDILGVREINLDAIELALPNLAEKRELYLKGITIDGIAILDGKKLINNPKIIVDDSSE
jgi:purine-binding chemotaxis protein CheW